MCRLYLNKEILIVLLLAALTQYACHYFSLSTAFRLLALVSSMRCLLAASSETPPRREKIGMLQEFYCLPRITSHSYSHFGILTPYRVMEKRDTPSSEKYEPIIRGICSTSISCRRMSTYQSTLMPWRPRVSPSGRLFSTVSPNLVPLPFD